MKKNTSTKKRVFVGLSGGVDSSVSAALLVKAGYDVTGVFIKVWQPDFVPCAWKEDRLDAMRVAAHLGIPFVTLDLEKEYKKGVVDYMIAEYKRGNTPNPDVMCNKEIKFGAFLKYAKSRGADYVATGHYARVVTNNLQPTTYNLLSAADAAKDQSYFLWTLKQEQLKHILFPVGGFQKSHVRALAKKFGLLTATKKDSQGLCFVGKVDMKEFLGHFIKEKTGDVVNETGEVVGTHKGVNLFTIGERHGFMITKKGDAQKPYYVVDKDLKRNRLVVSSEPEKSRNKGLIVKAHSANFISYMPKINKRYKVRFRYRQELAACTIISSDKDILLLKLSKPDHTISPGQSLVLYDKEKLIAGGIIQ